MHKEVNKGINYINKSTPHLHIEVSFDKGWKKQNSWLLNPWSNNNATSLHKERFAITHNNLCEIQLNK